MRILFVAPRFHTNQVPLMEALLAGGHQVQFHVERVRPSEDHSLVTPRVIPGDPAVAGWRLPLARGGSEWTPDLLSYRRVLKEFAPDAVVVREPTRPLSLVAALAARSLGAHVVFYTQSPVHDQRKFARDLLRGTLLTLFGAEWISPVQGNPDLDPVHPHYHYLPFACPLAGSGKSHWFSGDRINLLSIGKFYPRKNHLLLLEALARLREEFNVHLTIVGECSNEPQRHYLAQVREAVARHGLADSVDIRLNLPYRQVLQTYEEHDLFVLPSHDEPAAVSLLEAMARGLPVLCSDTNGTACYVEVGGNGAVFTDNDATDLHGKLRTLLASRTQLQAFGRRSLELVRERHEPAIIRDRLLEVIECRRGRALQPAPTVALLDRTPDTN